MNKFDLNSYLSSKRKKIENALTVMIAKNSKGSKIKNAMEYSLMSNGKRLRPILCIAAAETVGSHLEDDTMRTACAIEMIHTYSLIHDDLPAMDNDNLRRGQPTCHIKFDEATAILAGDALLTMAFEILSSVESADKDHTFNRLRVIQTIAIAAGCRGMIEGQMRDIAAEGNLLGLENLKKMHRLKTGALIEASRIGAEIAVFVIHLFISDCVDYEKVQSNDADYLEFLKYFDSETMSVHLKENLQPLAKRGKPGSFELTKINDEILTRDDLEFMAKQILDTPKTSDSSTIEISHLQEHKSSEALRFDASGHN